MWRKRGLCSPPTTFRFSRASTTTPLRDVVIHSRFLRREGVLTSRAVSRICRTDSTLSVVVRCGRTYFADQRHYAIINSDDQGLAFTGPSMVGSKLNVFLKLLGASAFVFVLFFVGTILFFPVADQFILPWAAQRTLHSKAKRFKYSSLADPQQRIGKIEAVVLPKRASSYKTAEGVASSTPFVGREKEIALLTQQVKKRPGKVLTLSGPTKGKSSIAKHLADNLDTAIYLDFRFCPGAHSAVFELCYQLYRPLGLKGVALASYFKLVQIFINTLTSNNGQNHACAFNFYELLCYLSKGIRIGNPNLRTASGQYPVIFVDHVETLFDCEAGCQDEKTLRQVYQTFLRSLAKWALSLCYDNKSAHVVFVTSSDSDINAYLSRLPGLKGRTKDFVLKELSEEECVNYLERTIIAEDKKELLFKVMPPEEIASKLDFSIVNMESFVQAINDGKAEDCINIAHAESKK